MATADGAVVIDTKISPTGFNEGIKKLQVSAATALNKVLLPIIKVSDKIQNIWASITSAIKSGLKGLITGLFIAFALSVGKIFAFFRESIQEAFKLSPDVARQWEEIQNSFVELKYAIGNAFLPLIQFAIPYIKQALSWLIEMFNKVAMITAAFMGQKQALQVIQGSAQKIADANKKTEKAARAQLAAFDQINTLQKPESEDTSELPKVASELVPVTNDILNKVQAIKDEIAQWFADPIGKLKETWGKIVDWFRANVLQPLADWWNSTWIGQLLGKLWENFTTTWSRIFENTKETFERIKENIKLALEGVKEFVIGVFTGDWALAWEGLKKIVKGVFGAIWELIKGGLENLWILFQGWGKNIKIYFDEVFAPAIGKALDWIREKFFMIFDRIQSFVQDTIYNIIGYIGELVHSILAGIAAISGISSPGVMGSVSAGPSIRPPRLATGAVIPPNAAFAAILGDQRSGRNLEAPEALIRQIVREETANQSKDIHITFEGSLAPLIRQLHPLIKQEDNRVGGSLIK